MAVLLVNHAGFRRFTLARRFRLLAVALEYLLTGRTQSLPVLLQALLDRPIVAQLLSAKARSIARARLLFLRSPEVSALG